ncbi:GNAT family N-acetyltransferase [Deinococcus cellulosilyticus]|uniref:N-acetyltransferase domain-containing protein n=1 Tax=Deinococcus cellulosilyticus (strain DSM 18568 / NBRC 106333 / KACC 11606 / 5516J-15) TaxID=1223518 RepID=A0A511MV84_DEIC1|nr:GNAT family N-acetyltransferase [Deinococcus cellulosilyticus]GEM44489.1 hypothetical protein DC3_01240 [Deinococcus cellulosilyticus NBRC 106333 = KACC 11606]
MLRNLTPEDRDTIKVWQEDYVAQHIAWWEEAYQTTAKNTPQMVAEKDWDELMQASAREDQHVMVYGEKPLGIIYGRIRQDPYLGLPIGQLSWIYVDPASRGLGVADQMIQGLLHWFTEQQVAGREVFVTAANLAAVRVYERNGFQVVDHRMLGPGK